jgi:hypothetical protein
MQAEPQANPDPVPAIGSPAPDNLQSHLPEPVAACDAPLPTGAQRGSLWPRIVTLGVYGFDEAGFFAALSGAHVDTFCDLRSRRGVRGRDYAFVNSQRLQARLEALRVRYFHFKELAPSPTLRHVQGAADEVGRMAKRGRTGLSSAFIAGYRGECLSAFDSRSFLAQLGPAVRVVALFCVERVSTACHRSLVAERLQQDLGVEVIHLIAG